jgi:hypothetical protein
MALTNPAFTLYGVSVIMAASMAASHRLVQWAELVGFWRGVAFLSCTVAIFVVLAWLIVKILDEMDRRA